MKKLKRALSLGCAALMIAATFSGCTAKVKAPDMNITPVDFSQQDSKSIKALTDGKMGTSVKLKQNEPLVMEFGEKKTIDTLILREDGDMCNYFKVEARIDGEWKTVYEQDRILEYHVCYLEEITTDALRIVVTDSKGDVKLCEATPALINKDSRPMKVSQYLVPDTITQKSTLTDNGFSGYYDVVTDVMLIGSISIDENAQMNFSSGEEKFAEQVATLKKIIGDRDVRIWACVNFTQKNEKNENDHEKTTEFINTKIEQINKTLKEFVEKYDLYGIDYDWEYPSKSKQWKAYDKIIIETAKYTNVSVALPPWGFNLSKDAQNALEHINIMAYDLFDERGDHSNAFVGGWSALNAFIKKGYDPNKLLLGLPTYARTVDKSANAWPTYADYEELGKWGNVVKDFSYVNENNEQVKNDAYLDSYAEARDKTALVKACGAGGIMIFRAGCDKPYTHQYSIHRAIGEVINNTK